MQDNATQTQENQTEDRLPIFEEIQNMTQDQAVNVLVQAAQLAQQSGKLNLKDSVLLAKAITVLRPGTL